MIKRWVRTLLDLWKMEGGSAWTPMPTLDAHLKHMAAGCAFVLFGLTIGLDWWHASLLAFCISLVIELSTAFVRSNWFDSGYDFLQYQAQWSLYIASQGYWYLFGAFCAVWFFLYFWMLTHE